MKTIIKRGLVSLTLGLAVSGCNINLGLTEQEIYQKAHSSPYERIEMVPVIDPTIRGFGRLGKIPLVPVIRYEPEMYPK